MKTTTTILLAGALALAACGGPPPEQGATPATRGEPAENQQLLNAVKEPLDRAKSVEQIEAEQKRAMDAQIDEQGR
jgi:hypothetical protein